jgi:hypothetical protein
MDDKKQKNTVIKADNIPFASRVFVSHQHFVVSPRSLVTTLHLPGIEFITFLTFTLL